MARTFIGQVRTNAYIYYIEISVHLQQLNALLTFITRVARNYKTVASPVIETIDEKTFQYKFVAADLMGTFNWKLEFDWGPVTQDQLAHMEHPWAPYKY